MSFAFERFSLRLGPVLRLLRRVESEFGRGFCFAHGSERIGWKHAAVYSYRYGDIEHWRRLDRGRRRFQRNHHERWALYRADNGAQSADGDGDRYFAGEHDEICIGNRYCDHTGDGVAERSHGCKFWYTAV